MADPIRMPELDSTAFWQRHGACILHSDQVVGEPFFYPIYRWKDLYSYSPLPLLIRKGRLDVDPEAVRDLDRSGNDVSRPSLFIDREIERIGAPPTLTRRYRDRDEFTRRFAKAMQSDAAEIEARNPGYTQVVLCGGRDSLNLLLLPWKTPVIALSAQPNLPLVEAFVRDNDLAIEVRELQDKSPSQAMLTREIAEACTLVDLENWKWAVHLCEIARDFDYKAVFWKGQLGDTFLTDYWRSYNASRHKSMQLSKKAWRKLARHLPVPLAAPIDWIMQEHYQRAIWERGAIGQGAHLGFLRSLTDCLWVSAYHGPRTAQTWLAADLPRLTKTDLRPEIGRLLLGREVIYPQANPAPSASEPRQGVRGVPQLREALAQFGVMVS